MEKLNVIFKELAPTSILDLHAGFGQYLYQAYHSPSLKNPRLFGFESCTLKEVLLKAHLRSTVYANTYDLYKLYAKHELKLRPKSRKNFDQNVSIEFGATFQNYSLKLDQVDLILAIRLIQVFKEEQLQAFKTYCHSMLKKNAYLFIVLGMGEGSKFNKNWLISNTCPSEDYKTIGFDYIQGENYILFQKL